MTTAAPNLEWAKNYVAGLNETQLDMLKQMYEKHRAQQEKDREQQQQQDILAQLTSQKPITVDVVRSSTSPESFTDGSSSASGSEIADGEITVKDVLLGKMKSAIRPTSPRTDIAPYKPRGTRERILFDGHLFTFDKLSYDCKKRFYRCERKNVCPARVHTPIDCDRVIHKAQTHNHPPPTANELAPYDINVARLRTGFVMHVNPIHNRPVVPSSILTPKSDVEEENLIPKIEPAVVLPEIKEEPVDAHIGDRRPVQLRLPDKFRASEENRQVELHLTLFLMQQAELRKELLAKKGELPTIFPPVPGQSLTLFLADLNDDVFHMVPVKERTTTAVLEAMQGHFKQETSRLMINIDSKFNVLLNQQMIDVWKTEEFLRVDTSKSNGWKIVRLSKVE